MDGQKWEGKKNEKQRNILTVEKDKVGESRKKDRKGLNADKRLSGHIPAGKSERGREKKEKDSGGNVII